MRRLVAVLLVFVVSRAVVGYVADHHEEIYPAGSADPTFEVANYIVWSNQMQDFGNHPYRDFEVEYPPGSIAVANLPYLVDNDGYKGRFILLSIAIDALGLWAVYRLARRRDSWWGVVAWLGLLPLLGPVAYTRLDIAVATCIVWSLERVEAGRWTSAGAWLGLGAAIKITPGLLLPAVILAAPKRWRPAVAATIVGSLFLLPFVTDVPELYDQVIAYHTDRGVHVESLWGSLALLARVTTGASVELVGAFGATDIESSFDTSLRTLSNIAAAAVLLDSALASVKRVRRGDGAHLVLVVGGALILLTAVGRVFSPQYLVWLVAPMAAGLAIAPRALRWSAVALAVATALAHFVYPVAFYDYLGVEAWAVVVGVTRNVALLVAGVLAVRAAWTYRTSGLPAIEEEQGVEAVSADVLVGPDR